MNGNDIRKANDILAQLNTHIGSFLKKLADEEYKIVDNPRIKKIVLREWCRCGMIFYKYETTNSWLRRDENTTLKSRENLSDFKIKQVNDNDVVVTLDDEDIVIPFEYTKEQFKGYCKKFFKPLFETMNEAESRHKKRDEENQKMKEMEEKLLSVHTDGKYTYQWKKCGHCNGQKKISVGTGEYRHQGEADSEGFYIETQVMEEVNCPSCHGKGGFIEYRTDGKYGLNRKPCSKWCFEQNQDNFIEIMTN